MRQMGMDEKTALADKLCDDSNVYRIVYRATAQGYISVKRIELVGRIACTAETKQGDSGTM